MFSCAKCAGTSTTPGTCHGKPMESYDAVNDAALNAAATDPLMNSLLSGRLPSPWRRK